MSNSRAEEKFLTNIDSVDRKKEVLNSFLDTFIEKGFSETSVRDLSASINTQSAGMYYYFPSKEDAVVACAEEAINRLEETLICPALSKSTDPKKMLVDIKSKLDLMAPTMKFFTQVRSTKKYDELLAPALEQLNERYKKYSEKLGEKLRCPIETSSDILYRCVMASTHYMVYGDNDYIETQMQLLENDICSILNDNHFSNFNSADCNFQ